jgi:hypothetical protein
LNTDTPLPPEEPAGENPPDGALIDYCLGTAATGPLTLEIVDKSGVVVRRFSTTDKAEPVIEKDLQIAAEWVRQPQKLGTSAGMHRMVWDLRLTAPEGTNKSYPMAAIYRNTPAEPRGPWALPGEYLVRLTAGGRSYEQPLTVKMDPRVQIAPEALHRQFEIAKSCSAGIRDIQSTLGQCRKIHGQLKELENRVASNADLTKRVFALEAEIAELEGNTSERRRGPRRGEPGALSLSLLKRRLIQLLELVDATDADPTPQAVAATKDTLRSLADLQKRWDAMNERELPSMNTELRKADLPEVGLQVPRTPRTAP